MKLKYAITSFSFISYLIFNHFTYAGMTELGVCTSNSGSLDPGAASLNSTILFSGSGYGTTPITTTRQGFSLVNCQNKVVNNAVDSKISNFTLAGSNIDGQSSSNVGGITYFKLINTPDPFVNKYGYISFDVQDTKYSGNNNMRSLAQKIDFWTGINGANESSTQGINVANIKLYFTAAPVGVIRLDNLKIGRVNLTVTGNDVNDVNEPKKKITVTDQTWAYLSFIINPQTTKTCSLVVNPTTVVLPTLSTRSFKNIGDEVGQTNFSMTTTCDNVALANTNLFGIMHDNNERTTTTNILKNSGTASNVAVKLYHYPENTPANLNTEFFFGTTDNSSKPKVTKNFYAKYYATGVVGAGTVSSQMNINIFYK